MHDVSELPLLQSALNEALAITGQELGNIQLIDWKMGHLEIMAQQGFTEEFLDCFRRVTIRDGCACGRALFNRQPVVIHDVTLDPRFFPFRNVAERAGFKAVQSTPLLTNSGALVGVLSTHGQHAPSEEQLGSIRSLAIRTAHSILRARAEKSSFPDLDGFAMRRRLQTVLA
ncbi:GAF domain-containing protein [Bradyrhizobium sp. USDA 4451]